MSLVTPLTLAEKHGKQIMFRDAVKHCQTLDVPELLSFLGNLDSEARKFERTDDVYSIFRQVASIARTELARKSPGTYVTLAILR